MVKAPSNHPAAPSIIRNRTESGCLSKFFTLIIIPIILFIATIYLFIAAPFIWLSRDKPVEWLSKVRDRLIYGRQRKNGQQSNLLPKN